MSLPQDDEWETVPRRNLNKIVPDENQLANLAYSEIQDRIKWATLFQKNSSHPAILKVPNDLFYGGELQPCARLSKLYNQLELLPKEGFPVVFHGVAGISQQEKGFSYFYNMAEIEVIKEYLKSLIQHLHRNNVSHVPPGEIGIISPYRKQVEKIQKAIQWDADLSKENLENVEVRQ